MQTIAIIGAGGKTGSLVLQKLLKETNNRFNILSYNGFDTSIFSEMEVERLNIVKGSSLDENVMHVLLKDVDIVMCFIGHKITDFKYIPLEENTLKNIVKFTPKNARIIYQSGYTGDPKSPIPIWMNIGLSLPPFNNIYKDKHRAEKILENSGIKYTILRPMFLKDLDDANYQASETKKFSFFTLPYTTRLSIAEFILNELVKNSNWNNKKPVILTKF